MEFFKIVDVRTTEKAIQKKLTLGNLEEFCESIFPLEPYRRYVGRIHRTKG